MNATDATPTQSIWQTAAVVGTALGAASALAAAIWAGLGRMGATGSPPGWLVIAHGPLIANGFFGAVISLERAVAVDRPAAFLVPLLAAWGTWAAMFGLPVVGRAAAAVGAVGLVAVFTAVTVRDTQLHHAVMGAGAAAWAAGAVCWLAESFVDWSAPTLAPWWAAFLVLTIAGERLELARVLRHGGWRRGTLVAALCAVLSGAAVATAAPDLGVRALGVGCAATAAWLGLFDVARRTARSRGLTAYIGRVLLVGYLWLAAGGAMLFWVGGAVAGPLYGAAWHAVFLGFVMSMIFAHAPVVLRAIAGLHVRFHPALYAAPVLLTATLILRVAADLAGWPGLRAAGGWGNAAAIVLFALTVVARLDVFGGSASA